ncbi:MAG TPA: hypothetical protein VGX75_12645 [bacterium]|nr:hypothetical protein [bacterium]
MEIFVAWFVLWLAGSVFGPVQYHPPDDTPPPDVHESSEAGGTR